MGAQAAYGIGDIVVPNPELPAELFKASELQTGVGYEVVELQTGPEVVEKPQEDDPVIQSFFLVRVRLLGGKRLDTWYSGAFFIKKNELN